MSSLEQAKARLANAAGVYLSDVKGHLLVIVLSPIRVTCVSCAETCNRLQFKNTREFKQAASAFVAKHGALDVKIADNLDEIIEEYLTKKREALREQGHIFDRTGRCVGFVPDPFDTHPDTLASLDEGK